MASVGNIDVRILPIYKENILQAMNGSLATLQSLEIDKDRFTVLFSSEFSKDPIFDEIDSIYYFFDGTDWNAFMDKDLTTPVPIELLGVVSITEDPSVPGLHPDFIAKKDIIFSGGKFNFNFEFSRDYIYPNGFNEFISISGILLFDKDQGNAVNLNFYPFKKEDTDTFIIDSKLEI